MALSSSSPSSVFSTVLVPAVLLSLLSIRLIANDTNFAGFRDLARMDTMNGDGGDRLMHAIRPVVVVDPLSPKVEQEPEEGKHDGTDDVATKENQAGTTNDIPPAAPASGVDDPPKQTNDIQPAATSALPPEVVVFYHIYLGKPDASPNYGIIQEQLRQLHDSYAYQNVTVTRRDAALKILYTTIAGNPDHRADFETRMTQLCAPLRLDCRHTQHHDQGFEEKTIAQLHEYCANTDNNNNPSAHDASVVYMHNKGSFHVLQKRGKLAGNNHHWRVSLTAATVEEKCYRGLHDDYLDGRATPSCNVCGTHITTFPSLRIAGNLWTASCRYVRQLHGVDQFSVKMEELTERLQELDTSGLLTHSGIVAPNPVWDDRFVGRERFRWEWYIALHPTFKICDLARRHYKKGFQFWKGKHITTDSVHKYFKLRRQLDPLLEDDQMNGVNPMMNKTALNNRADRVRDFLLIPGYMVRYSSLYQQLPTRQHWIWTHFPDGDLWKQQFDSLLVNEGDPTPVVQYTDVVDILKKTNTLGLAEQQGQEQQASQTV